jgi:hypothetical protein
MTKPLETAFPTGAEGDPGLTKREYFASIAMQGVLASATWEPDGRFTVNGANSDIQYIAQESVKMADALIEELNK